MRPRRALRIGRLEVSKATSGMDRSAAVAILVVLAAIGGMVPMLVETNPAPSEDLYRIGVDSGSPYYPAVQDAPELRAVPTDDGAFQTSEVEVRIVGETLSVRDTEAGRAAARAVREAVVSYNERLMRTESDQAAAFPVLVTLRYVPRDVPSVALADAATGDRTDTVSEGTTDTASTTATDSTDGGVADSETTGAPESRATATAPQDEGGFGPFDGLLGSQQTGTPTSISPPFPLRSLLLAFVFLLPFNVVIQAYGSSVFAERIGRRGEPLLVSPATRGDIIVGKTLPYLVGAIGITAVIAAAVGGGVRTVAAIVPLAGLFLGATFVAGMLARSYKELTFLTVTISVVLTAYAFVPAVFSQIHPIAAISPLSVVVNDLESVPFAPGAFALSTLPVTLATAVLFVFGAGMLQEEHMFTRRALPAKILDAMAAPLGAPWTVGLWTALYIPFVFVVELFVVASLFVLPASKSIPVLLAAIAVVEELAKSLHVFAGFERGRFADTGRVAITLGVLSGVGFFIAEKVMAITQLVGLPELEVGRAAFGPTLGGLSPGLLLLAPLALHVGTATLSAIGAARSRRAYLLGLTAAIVVHVGYNLTVVRLLA
ncbi:ABC transporter permease family protein [Halanaeroarchaeum sulfurireducens]|uniref:ABC-type transport system permease n=1 Tax=Halanaeroarchaeum sulfurireducens TaxID=1604004 RepID=A0A0F7PC23_9EURY|nr:ABC transporter permease subunit [Halanaeroarchaeum sulfurireducens]AKH97695.1 ABC-type transport system permease [Halanaeroarchaeum sulfurireducens]